MRTLLILFIFVFSRAVLASTEVDQTLTAARRDEFAECGELYDCYVPSLCRYRDVGSGNQKRALTLGISEVIRVFYRDPIYPDCPALVRIHLYEKYYGLISVESLLETTKSIEFIRKGTTHDVKDVDTKFTCALSGTPEKLYGQYSINLVYDGVHAVPFKGAPNEYPIARLIKCELDVKLGTKYEIFPPKTANTDKFLFQMKINNEGTTLSTKNPPELPERKCNADDLVYSDELKESTKKYEKIAFRPGNFYCKNSDNPDIFQIEYKKDENSEYAKATRLTCDETQFIVDTNVILQDDLVYIRCVADVNLFCDEGVKVDGRDGPTYVPPNRATKAPSTLTCPDGMPHLVVEGIDKPIQNASFECLAFGEEQFWTVKRTNLAPIRLTKDGPKVSCTKKLKCYLHQKIPESSVIGGDLDDKTYLPKCFDKGILYARQGDEPKAEIDPPYCNDDFGRFEYKVKGGRQEIVTDKTKFECTYPQEKEENFNVNTSSTVGGTIGGVVGVGIVAALLIGGSLAFAARNQRVAAAKQKQREADEMKYGAQVWKKYCMDKEEREALAITKKKGAKQEKTPKAGDEVYNWNRMLMSFQTKGAECTGANKDGVLPRKSRKDQNYRFKSDPAKIDPELFAKYEVMQTGGIREEAWRTPEYKALDELTHSMVLVEDEETKKMVEQLLDEIKNETICEQNKRDDTADYKKNMKDEQSYAYAPPRDSRY